MDKKIKNLLLCTALAAVWGCSEDEKSEDTDSDNTTSFGVNKKLLIDQLLQEEREAYCAWYLKKTGGAGAVVACPVPDAGPPEQSPDAGASTDDELSYYNPTVSDCLELMLFNYHCSAGDVEDCLESRSFDPCLAQQVNTPACQKLDECIASTTAPSNNVSCNRGPDGKIKKGPIYYFNCVDQRAESDFCTWNAALTNCKRGRNICYSVVHCCGSQYQDSTGDKCVGTSN